MYKALYQWYKDYGRSDLPWRNTDNPYHIYLSEVMLQQTQVKTVLERYYFPFLDRFPSIASIADASMDDVLKQWEGLGYYTRAKHLYKTATMIKSIPNTIEALVALPGVGLNTAHAIMAFAFKQPVPVMEANVKRVLCRMHQIVNPSEKELWRLAYAMVDRQNPFEYNQAMMDIGAMVCLPKNPNCAFCPLRMHCQGRETPMRYPIKKSKVIPQKEEIILLRHYDEKLALYQRQGRFLHALWGFESVASVSCSAVYIGDVTHAYTHFRLMCHVYVERESRCLDKSYFSIEEIKKIAISKVDEKILKLYQSSLKSRQ